MARREARAMTSMLAVVLSDIACAIVLIAFWFAIRLLRTYVSEKVKNQATKEDIRDITRQIEDVKLGHADALEHIRADLRSSVLERQARFVKLHEQRFQALVELYRRMDRVSQLWEASARPLRFNLDGDPENQRTEAVVLGFQLQELYYQNKLFFEQDLCKAVEAFLQTNQEISFALSDGLPHTISEGTQDQLIAVARKMSIDHANKSIPKLRPALRFVERKMQAILGIADPDNSDAEPAVDHLYRGGEHAEESNGQG